MAHLLKPWALLVLLIGCKSAGYGISYPPELSAAVMDPGVDCLIARVEELGLLTPGVAARHVQHANIVLSTYEHPIEEGPGLLKSGMYDPDGHMYLLWPRGSDVTESSFQHELLHALLCESQHVGAPTCWGDAAHDAHAWWRPVLPAARQCWKDRLALDS